MIIQARIATMAIFVALPFVVSEESVQSISAVEQKWITPLGSGDWSECFDVAADGHGNVYATGFTVGKIGGEVAKAKDAFLVKYDSDGKVVWTKLLGTKGMEDGNGVEVDVQGNVFTTGTTNGKYGEDAAGGFDAFVTKHDASGALLWKRQLGSDLDDEGQDIAIDKEGNAIVTGATAGKLEGANAGGKDVFLAKYDPSGELGWKVQFGSRESEQGYSTAVDGDGNVLVAGSTSGNLSGKSAGSDDIFFAKFTPGGKQLWIQQTGTAGIDVCTGIVADTSGNIFISGHTCGKLGESRVDGFDLFVAKYDADGKRQWVQQFGTVDDESCFDMDIDASGNLFLVGGTDGGMKGANKGRRDVFLTTLNPAGESVATIQLGTSQYDKAMGVSVDSHGAVFLGGESAGCFGESRVLDDADGFVAKLELVGDND